jgi:serine/threonine-protein kinase HipA
MEMAKELGIEVPEHQLVTDGDVAHFAVKRFDRAEPNLRFHVATASGLLHADHTIGSLSYEDLIKTAMFLTGDVRQAVEQYRRGVFNFLAVNRDDHAKNHGYLLGHDGRWRLTPVYDITYSSGPHGRHWTSVGGEDLNPSRKTLINLARVGSIPEREAEVIIDSTAAVVSTFGARCRAVGVPPKIVKMVEVQQEAAREALR